MSKANVEERITALERTVAELLRSRGPAKRVKDWTRTVGMFSGNELMKEIDEAGQRIRERDRQRARRRATKSFPPLPSGGEGPGVRGCSIPIT